MSKILFIDNFDSFSYNLVDEFELLGHELTVVRNHVELNTLTELALQSDLLVISPGPGSPQTAGNCLSLLARVIGKLPVLGICLGHQLIVEQQGGRTEKAPLPVHGKSAQIEHTGQHCFKGLSNPFNVGRYHSLVSQNVPSTFDILATVDSLVMSVFEPHKKLLGFQFHPESILTIEGSQLLANSIELLLNPLDETTTEALA